jgi:hypothetical protein
MYCIDNSYADGLNIPFALIALFLNTPLYFGIFLYLDEIVPNTYGIAKSCCFCFKKKSPKKVRASSLTNLNADTEQAVFLAEDPIQIQNLSK